MTNEAIVLLANLIALVVIGIAAATYQKDRASEGEKQHDDKKD